MANDDKNALMRPWPKATPTTVTTKATPTSRPCAAGDAGTTTGVAKTSSRIHWAEGGLLQPAHGRHTHRSENHRRTKTIWQLQQSKQPLFFLATHAVSPASHRLCGGARTGAHPASQPQPGFLCFCKTDHA